MKTCFVGGRTATRVDSASGELMCAFHFDPTPAQPPRRGIVVVDEWQRARAVQAWHAGSAYERDQAMAKRLQADLEPGWAWREQHRG